MSMKNSLLNEGYNSGAPLFTKGKGTYIYDKKKLLDLSFCAGSIILGHNHTVFKSSIKNYLSKNISNFAAPNIYAVKYANKIKSILNNCSKVIFCNSGTEAIIKSLRIVKAITNKKKIVAVTGSWHGSVDKLLFSADKNLKPNFLSAGLSNKDKKNLIFVPYNDIEKSKKILEKNKKDISCIIIEPVQGALPTYNCKKYLKFLRSFSKKNKSVLIFDEMITGLRTQGTSLQNYFKIKADISIFGKTFGGGLPLGIICISKKIENKINKQKQKIFFGGTFSGNSFVSYVGLSVFNYIQKNKSKIFNRLDKLSFKFESELNTFFISKKLDLKIYRFGSLMRIIFTNRNINNRIQRDFFEQKKFKDILNFKKFLYENNIYYSSSGLIFFSYSTTEQNVNYIIKVFKEGCLKHFVKKK